MDKFQDMAVFVAVAEQQGFAAAARVLNLSAPAVTRAVAALESRIGTLLLTRNTRSVRLTEAGQRYYADCRRILQEIDDAADTALGAEAPPRGLLTITAPVLFGERFITPIIIEFMQRYPQLTVKSLFLDRVVNLQEESVDVAIRIAPLNQTVAQAELVGQVSRVVCAAPALLQREGLPVQPSDLLRYRLIHASAVGDWRFLQDGQITALDIVSPFHTNSNQAAIRAATRGWGITRVMSYQISTELQSGALKLLLTDFELPPVPIHVVCPEGRKPSAKVQRFVAFCSEKLRAHPALN